MKVELEAGDVVRLKSGGPLMTVEEIKTGDNAACVWSSGTREPNGNTQLQRADFPTVSVTPINPYANFQG